MRKLLTQEEAEKRFEEHGLKLVGLYINSTTRVETECKFCKKIFLAKPSNVFTGETKSCGCQRNKSLSQEYVENKAKEYGIIITGKYVHSQQRIECLCPICSKKFSAIPYDIMRGRTKSCGCKNNFLSRERLSQEEAEKRSLEIGIKLIGKYIARHRKTEFECPKCKQIFLAPPKGIWLGHYKTCGNCKYHDIKVGKTIGKHTIIKLYRKGDKGYWLEAKCTCGEIWIGKRSQFILSDSKICSNCDIPKIGEKYNKLTIVNVTKNGPGSTVKAICECGGYWYGHASSLLSEHKIACGNCCNTKNGHRTSSKVEKLHKIINNGIHNYNTKIGYNIDIALAINNIKIAVEYDEWYWHGYKIKKDLDRLSRLRKNGWKTLQIRAHGNLPSEETLFQKLNELIYTKAKKRTITLSNWGQGNTILDRRK